MTVKKLKELVDSYQEEICCDGESTSSHMYPSDVEFWFEGNPLKIKNHFPMTHGGCGCWTGIIFEMEEENN